MHVHLAVLCAGGTRLAPTVVECRPAARVQDHRGAWTLRHAPWGKIDSLLKESWHLIVNRKMNRNCVAGWGSERTNRACA